MKKGWMYILECGNGAYYTGSTNNLELRLKQHQSGDGANFTKKHLPVELVYFEEFQRIDEAFYREKHVQGWCRKKKEALIKTKPFGSAQGSDVERSLNVLNAELHDLAECKNETHFKNKPLDSTTDI